MDYKTLIMAQAFNGDGGGGTEVKRATYTGTFAELNMTSVLADLGYNSGEDVRTDYRAGKLSGLIDIDASGLGLGNYIYIPLTDIRINDGSLCFLVMMSSSNDPVDGVYINCEVGSSDGYATTLIMFSGGAVNDMMAYRSSISTKITLTRIIE